MAYCTNSDVKIHAPQADDGIDFTPWITQGDAVIDSYLRSLWDVPLDPVPQLIVNCSSMLAASLFLRAQYSQINAQVPDDVEDLGEKAKNILTSIVDQPSMLGAPLREPTTEDYNSNGILTAGGNPVFTDQNETTWGYE